MLKIKGKTMLDAGLIAKVVSETNAKVQVEIVELFFPIHLVKGDKTFRVGKDRRDWLKDRLVGQTREFWKTGTRMNMEVGGEHQVIDWNFEFSN